jgi:hypothetical protein
MVADEIVKTGKRRGPIRELRTCGKIVVGKRARLICEHLEAHGGIESQGIIDAKDVICGGTLTLGAKSEFKGELHAHAVVMEPGAKVKPSPFHIPSDPRGLNAEEGIDPRKGKKKP